MIPASCFGVPFVELKRGPGGGCGIGNAASAAKDADSAPPSLQSVKFWSDRFYLNATRDEEREWKTTGKNPDGANVGATTGEKGFADSDATNSLKSQSASIHPCICGHGSPPPLFPRETFVQSLQLKAAIMGTYVWSPSWFAETFPEFVNGSVPTLLLHGHKGMTHDYFDRKTAAAREEDHDTDVEEESIDGDENEDANQDEDVAGEQLRRNQPLDTELLERYCSTSTFRMNYVRCNWKKQVRDSSQFVSHETKNKKRDLRETRLGVHHPKFMLLLEQSGSLVVLVTTANLTPTKTVEGTWIQRFHPVRRRKNQKTVSVASSTENNHQNDFGAVLQDFVTKLREASERPTLVDEFMVQHFGCLLSDLAASFHFHTAQVYLVPVVPGDYPGPSSGKTSNTDNKRQYFYGHQRVQHVLNQMARDTPRNSKRTRDKTKSDRLVLQPTSLGADWTRQNFSSLVRGYMGYPTSCEERNDHWVCGQADVVWPSDKLIASLSGGQTLDNILHAAEGDATHAVSEAVGYGGSFVFNSSETFNRSEWEILKRMCQFKNTIPQQVRPKVPHFKSVARIITNHDAEVFKQIRPGEADTYFSWFLLTSACLSHGAQGVPVDTKNNLENYADAPEYDLVGYRNFELGVMFTSNILRPHVAARRSIDTHRKQKKQRLYCFQPYECSCSSPSSNHRVDRVSLVHLPVPYNLRPESYFHTEDDEEDLPREMKETPFFHSILPTSRCSGNMLMTPFGRQVFLLTNGSEESPNKRPKFDL